MRSRDKQQRVGASAPLPESFAVTLFDAMILYYNVMRARQLGWTDADTSVNAFIKQAKSKAIKIPRKELESMLYSCVINGEKKKTNLFWHPSDETLEGFIKELMRHQETKDFYYDTYYNFFTRVDGENRLSVTDEEESTQC